MMFALVQWVSDGLVALGLLFITAAIIGMYRLPSVLTRVHAAGAVPFGGALVIIGATLATGDGWLLVRGLLVAACMMLTIPSSAHAIAWLAVKRPELAHDKGRRGNGSETGEPEPPGRQ